MKAESGSAASSKRWSADAWLFLFLVGGYGCFAAIRFEPPGARVLALGLAVTLITLYLVFIGGRLRFFLVFVVIAVVVVAPTVLAIQLRQASAPYDYAHDGLIQAEEAVKFVLSGRNPYAQSYQGTPMGEWPLFQPDPSENPALFHLAYLPFLYLFWLPFYLLANATICWFDGRFVLLPLFLIMLDLLARLAPTPARARAVLLAVGLNPLLVPYLAEGRNDIFVLFWLVLSVFLLQRGRQNWSVVALALACASKLTAWFVLPFYAFYFLYQRQKRVKWRGVDFYTRVREALPRLALFAVMFSVLVLPFFLWDPAAFVEDVIRFPAGRAEHTFPIRGIGFARLALEAGLHLGEYVPFPSLPFYLLFGIPTVLIGWRWQMRHNSMARLWLAAGVLSLVIGFFAHVFHANHLGYSLSLFALGWLLEKRGERVAEDVHPLPAVAPERANLEVERRPVRF